MTWIARSLPREADDDPPPSAPPTRTELLRAERAELLGQVRPRVRSARQERIRRRIEEITRTLLGLEGRWRAK